MTILTPTPLDRRARKELDNRYKTLQLNLLQQCTPGTMNRPPPGDEQIDLQMRVMAIEGYLVEVEPKLYVITAKGQEYRDRLQRPAWRQWLLDNAQWVIPTIVAIASTVTAICAVIVGAN